MQSADSGIRRLAKDAVLVVLALALSYLERLIPVQLLIPIPGVKLGFSTMVILYAVYECRFWDVLGIVLAKCILLFLLFGSGVTFMFSLLGGLLSALVMFLLKKGNGKVFSIYGVSIAGAAFHHIGQIAAAMIMMNTTMILSYLPVLLLCSIVVGSFSAVIVGLIMPRLKTGGKTENLQ